MDEASKNTQTFAKFSDMDARLMYNFVAMRDPKHIFEQIFRWPQPEVKVQEDHIMQEWRKKKGAGPTTA